MKIGNKYRGTGRTTAMWLRALAEWAEGNDVVIVMATPTQVNHIRNTISRAIDMIPTDGAFTSPFNGKRLSLVSASQRTDGLRGSVFIDHFAVETLLAERFGTLLGKENDLHV